MNVTYEIDEVQADLVVRDALSREVLWQGAPLGRRVEELLTISETDDAIVLLEYPPGTGCDANLARVDKGGRCVWRIAPTPDTTGAIDSGNGPGGGSFHRGDAFVEITCVDNKWLATTYSGFLLTIDPASGATLHQQFVK